MNNNDCPITPPPELVEQWKRTAPHILNDYEHYHYITICATQWGADQELEACCALIQHDYPNIGANALRAARRPKPPSLKAQAIAVLDDCSDRIDAAHENIIRRALEALDD